MSHTWRPAGAGAETSPQTQAAALLEAEGLFRILVVGDFSGRASGGCGQPSPRLNRGQPVRVEVASFDLVLERMAPVLRLGHDTVVTFARLDDFHPDHLFASLELFQRLRQARAQQAAREQASAHAASGHPGQAATPGSQDAHLLDAASGLLMRALLHHPAFQALEAAWRGVHFLVTRFQQSPQVHVFLWDLPKQELAAQVGSGDFSQIELYRVLTGKMDSEAGEGWWVIAGNYVFEPTSEDAVLLGRVARLAAAARAPFIAEVAAEPLPPEAAAAWEELRRMPEAAWIGLALPRFLLRLPYGRQSDPIRSFPFEEMVGGPEHSHYLWGNPCFACAYLLASAFVQWGWRMRPGMVSEIDGLPEHSYEEEGELKRKPCAELVLSSRAVEEILAMGYIPVLSVENRGAVRLPCFQSLALPSRPLAGPWD